MTFSLGEGRKNNGEEQGEDKNDSYGIRTCGKAPCNREPVKKPNWNNEENQDDGHDNHRRANGYTGAVIVMNGAVVRFLSRVLLSQLMRWGMKRGLGTYFGAKDELWSNDQPLLT